MKQIILIFLGVIFISSMNAQDTCPETLICKDDMVVSALNETSISVYDFLENGSELDECDDKAFFLSLEVLDGDENLANSLRGFHLSCPFTNGIYDVVISRNDNVNGNGFEITSTCFTTVEITGLYNACSGNSSKADLGLIIDCTDTDKVGFYGEAVQASNGEQICVPFRVSNFTKILTFQSEVVWDPEVLDFTQIKSTFMDFVYNDDRSSEGVLRVVSDLGPELQMWSADDGDVFMEMCFEIIGDAQESSLVSLGTTYDFTFEVAKETNGVPGVAEYCLSSAIVSVTGEQSFQSNYSMSLNGQELETSGSNFPNVSSVLLQQGENVLTFQTQNFDSYLQNISTLDLVVGLKMFLLDEPIDLRSAVALDVDQSGGINVADLVMMRQLILGQRIDLPHPGNFFVRTNYNYGTDFDIYDFGLFDRYTFDSDEFDGGDLLFEAHQYGDLSKHNFHHEQTEVRSLSEDLAFENKYLVADQPTQVQFKIDGQSDFEISGFQSSLILKDAKVVSVNHNYSGSSFLSHDPEDGVINLLYADTEPMDELVFELVIESEVDGFVGDKLSLNEKYKVELVKDDLSVAKLDLAPQRIDSKKFTIVPNPFNELATVSVPQEYLGGDLIISNVLGKRIYNSLITNEEISLDRGMLKSSGVYLVTLEAQNRTMTRKIVFQE